MRFYFVYLSSGLLYFCVSKDVRICDYFSKSNDVREQKRLGNIAVGSIVERKSV